MLTRTLFFIHAGTLVIRNDQLNYQRDGEESVRMIPLDDVGYVIIESPHLMISSYCLARLAENNVAVLFCDPKSMPVAQSLPLASHTTTQKHIEAQLQATEALKGRLWRQTIIAKINNQAICLKTCKHLQIAMRLHALATVVKNGDTTNVEAQAARLYFQTLAPYKGFTRDPDGPMPNTALNYGYAIIRAAVARSLVGSGLTCVTGIHHHNQYNAFCLADDIMEPYRPWIDEEVFNHPEHFYGDNLTTTMKQRLLSLLVADVHFEEQRRPLMNAIQQTTASLVKCFLKQETMIKYPSLSCPSIQP